MTDRPDIDGFVDETERLRNELKDEKARSARLLGERSALAEQINLIETAHEATVTRPRWPKRKGKGGSVTAHMLVTDTHFDEVVEPSQVDGLNAYDRGIAEMRIERAFTGAIKLARDYLKGVTFEGFNLMLGGDIFSGNIHEELRRTNADTLFGSLLHWLGPVAAGLELLADEFERVHVVGVPGNHGRQTRKPIAKERAADNLDWLFYSLLARDFRDDERLTFQVGAAADAHCDVMGTRYLLTHGDQFRGGSGIAGAMSPLMLGAHRKTQRETAANRPYDVMVMGHFHQRISIPGRGVLVGGCLKGYDEYAYVSNFAPEPPSQEFWTTSPEHGITFQAPVFVQDRKAEGW